VRRHKEEAGCDGLRDKTKFKPLSQFTDMDIVNDYRLMEEVTKQVDKCKRDKIKRSTRQGNEMMVAPRLQKHLQRLQSQARSRTCRLRILPPHFIRRKNNSSMYDFREKVIKWHVELKFPNIDQTVTLPSINERTKLWRLISDFVEFKCADDPTDPFQHYRAVSYGGICLYLKAEGLPGPGETSRHFYPLDMKRSLKTGLKNTRIVEHPIIHVVFTRDEHMYLEEQDLVLFEEEKSDDKVGTDDPSSSENPTLGDVLSQTDAMQADPEAYKQYFDFYLKYYTSKYAQQGVNPEESSQALPNPYAGLAQNIASNTYPQRAQLSNNTFPKRTQNSNSQTFNRVNPPNDHQNVNPKYKETQNSYPSYTHNQKYPNRSHYQSGPSKDFHSNHQINHQKVINQSSEKEEVNRSNTESARKIQQELKEEKFTNPLGGLVAYDDSDSD